MSSKSKPKTRKAQKVRKTKAKPKAAPRPAASPPAPKVSARAQFGQEFTALGHKAGTAMSLHYDGALGRLPLHGAQDTVGRLIERHPDWLPDTAACDTAQELLDSGQVQADARELCIEFIEAYWRGVYRAASEMHEKILSGDHVVKHPDRRLPLWARDGVVGRAARAFRD